MSEWIPFVIAVDLIAVAVLIGRHIARRVAWPELAPRPYICPDCAKLFTNAQVLSLHLRGEHSIMLGPLKLPPRNLDIVDRRRRRRGMLRLVPMSAKKDKR